MAKRALVAFYSTALWFMLVVNLLLGIYQSWAVVNRRQSIVNQCIAQTVNTNTSEVANEENKLTASACNDVSKAGIWIVIMLFVIQWLIQLCEASDAPMDGTVY